MPTPEPNHADTADGAGEAVDLPRALDTEQVMDTSRVSALRRTRSGRWWLRRIGYPEVPDGHMVPYADPTWTEMRIGMRRMLLAFTLILVLLVGVVPMVAVGLNLPGWSSAFLTPGMGFAAVLMLPGLTLGRLLSGYLWLWRKDWADDWEKAGVPLMRLWMLLRPPLTREQYAAYAAAQPQPRSRVSSRAVWKAAAAATDVPNARPDTPQDAAPQDTAEDTADHTDATWLAPIEPHLVWWLHAHQITPDHVTAYQQVSVPAALVPDLVRVGLTPDEFGRLTDGEQPLTPPQVHAALRLWRWLSTTEAGNRLDGTPADRDARLEAGNRWLRLPGTQLVDLTPCPADGDTSADFCDWCFRHGKKNPHQPKFFGRRFGKPGYQATPTQWATAGVLAPYAIRAGIPLDEFQRMVASSPESVTGEMFDVLAALTAED